MGELDQNQQQRQHQRAKTEENDVVGIATGPPRRRVFQLGPAPTTPTVQDGTSDGGAVAETMGADLRSTQPGKERSVSRQADWGGGGGLRTP